MPLYTFKCPSCSVEEEIMQKMDDDNPICKRCADSSLGVHLPKMERVWQPTSRPKFKGNGFYETDYKNKPS